jgi:KaiC/GvpD/RAD55 family RecA-like ATPase
METFGWDIAALQSMGKFKIYKMNLHTEDNVEKQIEEELKVIARLVKQMGCKRLVIDSSTAFGLWVPDIGKVRYLLYTFADNLKDFGCTTILISETKDSKTDYSAFGVEEFVSDGVIVLYFTPPNRNIFIRKMRGTNHSKSVHPFLITDMGIEVRSRDEVSWEALK